MQRTVRFFVAAAAIGVTAMPAFAQVYPERLAESARHVREAYQRRDRGDSNRSQAVDRFSRTVRIGSDGTLDVSNIAGDIVVSRGSGSEAKIDVVRTAGVPAPASTAWATSVSMSESSRRCISRPPPRAVPQVRA